MSGEYSVKELNINDVLQEIFGDDYFINPLSMGEETKILLNYCKDHNYYLYERTREEFMSYEGYKMALEGGFNGVIYSCLS
jgi:hypothetical protein